MTAATGVEKLFRITDQEIVGPRGKVDYAMNKDRRRIDLRNGLSSGRGERKGLFDRY